MREIEPNRPNQIVAVEEFGAGLASGQWNLEEATTHFAQTVLDIGGDAELIADDLSALLREENRNLKPDDPATPTIIKMTTRSIICRNDFDSIPLPPYTDEPGPLTQQLIDEPGGTNSRKLNIDQVAADTTEGVLWIDPGQQAWRDKMTVRSAELLKALVSGMESQGYPRATAKGHIRQEFEAELVDLASRTSYAALGMLPYVIGIQAEAGLLNARSIGRMVRSFVMQRKH